MGQLDDLRTTALPACVRACVRAFVGAQRAFWQLYSKDRRPVMGSSFCHALRKLIMMSITNNVSQIRSVMKLSLIHI